MIATFENGKLKVTSAERNAALLDAKNKIGKLKGKPVDKMNVDELKAVVHYLLVRLDILEDVIGS